MFKNTWSTFSRWSGLLQHLVPTPSPTAIITYLCQIGGGSRSLPNSSYPLVLACKLSVLYISLPQASPPRPGGFRATPVHLQRVYVLLSCNGGHSCSGAFDPPTSYPSTDSAVGNRPSSLVHQPTLPRPGSITLPTQDLLIPSVCTSHNFHPGPLHSLTLFEGPTPSCHASSCCGPSSGAPPITIPTVTIQGALTATLSPASDAIVELKHRWSSDELFPASIHC